MLVAWPTTIIFAVMEADKLYFITATILEWKHLLVNDAYKDMLINEWRHRVTLGHLKVSAFVIMPNHYHAIINTPSPHHPSDIQRDIHKWVSRQIILDAKANNPHALDAYEVNAKDRKYQIWERNSLPVPLYTRDVILQKLNYIHNNPLQDHWRLTDIPEAYYYSSAKFYMENDTMWDFLTSVYE
jgi:REP element-mobilizing transposase RayT